MTVKEELHRIVDLLPDAEIQAVLRFLQYLREARYDDRVSRLLMSAPEDPEPLTAEEALAVDRALEEFRKGQTIPWEEVRRQIAD